MQRGITLQLRENKLKINANIVFNNGRFGLDTQKSAEFQRYLAKYSEKWGGRVGISLSAPIAKGTEAQNRAMHALLAAYYKTNQHSEEDCSLEYFKTKKKIDYGVFNIHVVDGKEVLNLVSWADYTKDERTKFISGLMSEIMQTVQPLTAELEEIIIGMGM